MIGAAHIQEAQIRAHPNGSAPDSEQALIGRERLYWREADEELETAVYGAGSDQACSSGPAVLRLESTTGLVHPGQHARIDEYGNVRMMTTSED